MESTYRPLYFVHRAQMKVSEQCKTIPGLTVNNDERLFINYLSLLLHDTVHAPIHLALRIEYRSERYRTFHYLS